MNATVAKFAPTAVVLAAAGSCAWPYLGGPEPEPEPQAPPSASSGRAAGPEIPPALLKPARPPRPDRDPFQDPEVLRNEARERIALLLKRLVRPAHPAGSPAGAVGQRPAAPGAPRIDPREGLVLSATSAHDRRGAAVINGRVYLTGDPVPCARTREPSVLASVRPDRVILRHRGQSYPLDYPALSAAAPAGRRPAPPARPPARGAGARKSPPARK